MTVTHAALGLFALVALLGMFLAVAFLSEKRPFPGLRRLHRLAAMFALATLAAGAARGVDVPGSWYAFAILTLAFLGGLLCWGMLERQRRLPPALIFGHGLAALAGIIVLTTVALS